VLLPILTISWPGRCESICSRISVGSSAKRDISADILLVKCGATLGTLEWKSGAFRRCPWSQRKVYPRGEDPSATKHGRCCLNVRCGDTPVRGISDVYEHALAACNPPTKLPGLNRHHPTSTPYTKPAEMAPRTRKALRASLLDDKIDILNRDADEASSAKQVFRTVSATLALVRVSAPFSSRL